MEKFTVQKTSRTSAEVSDILLSETGTTRRIFRAEIVRRPAEKDWHVKGSFICQRKRSGDVWEDTADLKLSQMRAGECVAVHLDTIQTERLIDGLESLLAAAGKGVKAGKRQVVVADPEAVVEITDRNRKKIIERLIHSDFGEEVWNSLAQANPDLATRLSYSRIQQARQDALRVFAEQLDSQEWTEPQWEQFFFENQWIFGYGLRYQFLGIEQRQSNYGGESFRGTGKQRGEFLTRTSGQEKFTVVVEIKKPQTNIFPEREYRRGVPGFSTEFIAAISQAQVNSRTWDVEGSRRSGDRELLESRRIFTIAPRSILVIGSTEQLQNHEKRQAFELYRRNLHNPDILTFDELYERAKYIVEFGNENAANGVPTEDEPVFEMTDDDMPF